MSLRHALLGFLAITPLSGYDLRRHMHESVAHFWPVDQSQIYRTLAQLEKDGLVEVREVHQDGRPDRRDHSITPEGLATLDAWLASPGDYSPAREPFLLRLFFVARLGPERTREVVEERIAEAREMLAVLTATRQAIETAGIPDDLGARLRLATLENGAAHARAEIDWAQQLLTTL